MQKTHLFTIAGTGLIVFFAINFCLATTDFTDVPKKHVNYDAINYVVDQKIATGYQNNTFRPQENINRAEFIKIITNARFGNAGADNCITQYTNSYWTYVFFPDVLLGQWYAKYVCLANVKNIISGYPDRTFRPANFINFAEASKAIIKAFDYTVGSDPVWYMPYVEKLLIEGFIPNTIKSMDQNLTRGEVMEIIYLIKDSVAKEAAKKAGKLVVAIPPEIIQPIIPTLPTGSSDTAPEKKTSGGAGELGPQPTLQPTLQPTPNTPASNYYVSSTNCSDSNPGTREEPFCTIQIGVNKLQAGQTLVILNGIYKEGVIIKNSGTAEQPIIIKGESKNNVIIEGGCVVYPCKSADIPVYARRGALFNVGNKNNITLQDFTVKNAVINGVAADGANNLIIQNLLVNKTGGSGINVYSSKNLKLTNNEITGSNFGYITLAGTKSFGEESVSIVASDGFEVFDNYLHDSPKEGIDTKVGSQNGKVSNNKIERLCAVGIYINEAHKVDVYENIINDIGFIGVNGAVKRCAEAFQEYGTLSYEVGHAILIATGDLGKLSQGKISDIKVYKNIVYNVAVGCIKMWDQLGGTGTMENISIYNNVLYKCSESKAKFGPAILVSKAIGLKIINNIIAQSNSAISGNLVGAEVNNNLFFNTGSVVGSSQITGDPMFADPDNGDFKLQTTSPAIDAGKDVGLPKNNEPDIGAFEFGL